jgi:ATP-dependent helicase YprA (DUF1998 family)
MDPFEILDRVQRDYLTYVRTFQRFQNPRIQDWVMDRIEHGTLLWKPPFVQLSRPFAPGDRLETLVEEGLLHPGVLPIFRADSADLTSPPVKPYKHQSDAIRAILTPQSTNVPTYQSTSLPTHQSTNVIVATGTGSGKSFAFGIPIVSEALKMREKAIGGIKAVIVYPMNALANSQYDDFSRRLHGSGLTIARYTGDTAHKPEDALDRYRRATGRDQPYDSQVLSRREIQADPPDILMTNYVMLELLLTRFHDRQLFAQPGVLRFLVLDEVHTYTGKRGADVAALIRRLKQHTHTVGRLRCIGTSATVESAGDISGSAAVADFAQRLFGEPFAPENVITESYAPLPEDLPPLTRAIAEALADGPRTVRQLAADLEVTPEGIQQALLPSSQSPNLPISQSTNLPVPKLHAFFSQGRAIAACLEQEPHLNDRGERVCPVCAEEGRERTAFPLVFCRACGQEYWSVAVDREGELHPANLGDIEAQGRLGYILEGRPEIDLPDNWLTKTGKVRGGKSGYQDVVPEEHTLCPVCARLDSDCDHNKRPVTFLPAPFLLCPTCGIVHDRRPREYNKLFTFGSVGRSTATDVLVNAQVQSLPRRANKVIAFSDNRQDTALQAAHMNSLHRRFTFRQALYTALRDANCIYGQGRGAQLGEVGHLLFMTQHRHGVLPRFRKSESLFKADHQAQDRYRQYLDFLALWELGGTHRRTHQNLEDVGLLAVGYRGLENVAAADGYWADVPWMADLDVDVRYDLLLGLMDLMRKRHALPHPAILEPYKFEQEIIANLHEDALIHDQTFRGPIGYSDTADDGYPNTVYRLTTSPATQPLVWTKRVFDAIDQPLEHAQAVELVQQIVEKLGDPQAEFLVHRSISPWYRKQHYDVWMVSPDLLLWADPRSEHWRCPKCGTVHRFRSLRVCTGSTCRTTLEERDLTDNYFRQVYATPLGEAVPVRAEEHSGQVAGKARREIELRFREEDDPLNVLVCTPTMELGIDIGHLNAITLRNVPPSPSNYAQRAGRAGRSGQPALISVFAGVGASRGPHDQYFYRFPEKMIAGAIAAPRFRLDNQALIRAHVHALVLETMSLKGAEGLPSEPRLLLDIDGELFPLSADWRSAYQAGIEGHFEEIVQAVEEAFADEIASCDGFEWFDRAFIEEQVRGFLDDLDDAMDRWRDEYDRLDAERRAINRQLGEVEFDYSLDRRRSVIENKLQAMREGKRDWYLYRYLGGEGFLPGYAFPPQAAVLAFDDQEDEMARDPDIALTEYAPGNFVYYRGERYEVTHARPRRRRVPGSTSGPDTELDVERVLVCPACQRAYVGEQETNRAGCACGQDLTLIHPQRGMQLTDMYAKQRAHITADEEERLRLGYEVTSHYRAGGAQRVYQVRVDGEEPFRMTLEHGGEVLRVNRGQRQQEGVPQGFSLCGKCHRWLIGDDAPEDHVYTHDSQGRCPRHAKAQDLVRGLWLTKAIHSDLVLFDVPLRAFVGEGSGPLAPDEVDAFYTTLSHTLERALMVAFNLDEREIGGFLAPAPEAEGVPYRVVLYETTVGGSGVLASLAEPGRLATVVERARELLHEGDPEGGCQRACYACLLSFYNQRVHHLLDRTPVLPWLQELRGLTIEPLVSESRFEALAAQCDSELERKVLAAIRDRGLPLPDEAQRAIYDGDVPLAIADFFYEPKIVVFVDGSPHHRDYVQQADQRKRMRLKGLGYRVVVVQAEQPETGLDNLASRLGH